MVNFYLGDKMRELRNKVFHLFIYGIIKKNIFRFIMFFSLSIL